MNESIYFVLVWKWGILHPVLWVFRAKHTGFLDQGGDGQILAVYDLGGGTFDISHLGDSGGVSWAAKWPETWISTGSEISGPSPETNSEFTPENWWLGDDPFLFGGGLFLGANR